MLPRVFGRRPVPTDSTLQDTRRRKSQKIVEGGKAVASQLLALPGRLAARSTNMLSEATSSTSVQKVEAFGPALILVAFVSDATSSRARLHAKGSLTH
jgi:hypothetical protein